MENRKIIIELDEFRKTLTFGTIHYIQIISLIENLSLLSRDVIVSRYSLKNKNIALELLYKKFDLYINIEINPISIEIRWETIELYEFFDSDVFNTNRNQMISDFFLGEYHLLTYFCLKNSKNFTKIKWNRYSLNLIKNKFGSFSCTFSKLKDTKKGICLLKIK